MKEEDKIAISLFSVLLILVIGVAGAGYSVGYEAGKSTIKTEDHDIIEYLKKNKWNVSNCNKHNVLRIRILHNGNSNKEVVIND